MIREQVPVLDVMITVEGDLVGLKWAFMSLQIELSDLLPGHIGVYFTDTLKSSANSDAEKLFFIEGDYELYTGTS